MVPTPLSTVPAPASVAHVKLNDSPGLIEAGFASKVRIRGVIAGRPPLPACPAAPCAGACCCPAGAVCGVCAQAIPITSASKSATLNARFMLPSNVDQEFTKLGRDLAAVGEFHSACDHRGVTALRERSGCRDCV